MSPAATLLRKECRALAALSLVIAGGILLGELQHDFRDFEALFYVIGALALGATSVGHEYRHGTLAQLLTQPVSRARIFAVKFAVLGVFLLALSLLAFLVIFRSQPWDGAHRHIVMAIFVLPAAYGFLVAPWLTVATRNTLAGTLFSGSLAAFLFLGGDRFATWRGFPPDDVRAFSLEVVWIGSSLLCTWAAFSIWRSVSTLEAADGVRSDVALPMALRASASTALRRRHPLLRLALKELRLQQLTFLVSGLYTAFFLLLHTRTTTLFDRNDALMVVSLIHAVIVAALAGALSCAEERGLGTLQWQLLQPVSVRVQFAVKIAVTLAMTFALAIGLPALLVSVFGATSSQWAGSSATVFSALALLLAGSIYLSSIAPSAVTAFFLCVPGFVVATWFMQRVVRVVGFRVFVGLYRLPNGRFNRPFYSSGELSNVILVAVALLALALAFENHRRTDRPVSRAALQLAGVAVLLLVTAAGLAATGRWPF